MKNCRWNFKYDGGEIKKGRARGIRLLVTSKIYFSMNPTNRKKIKRSAVGRWEGFWSSAARPNIPVYPRGEEASLPNQFRSKPLALIPFPTGLIQPRSLVISVVHPPKNSSFLRHRWIWFPRRRCSRVLTTFPGPSVPLYTCSTFDLEL